MDMGALPNGSHIVAGNISSSGLVNGVEGCSPVESGQKHPSRLVYSDVHSQYTGNPGDSIHLRFQSEGRIASSMETGGEQGRKSRE